MINTVKGQGRLGIYIEYSTYSKYCTLSRVEYSTLNIEYLKAGTAMKSRVQSIYILYSTLLYSTLL